MFFQLPTSYEEYKTKEDKLCNGILRDEYKVDWLKCNTITSKIAFYIAVSSIAFIILKASIDSANLDEIWHILIVAIMFISLIMYC